MSDHSRDYYRMTLSTAASIGVGAEVLPRSAWGFAAVPGATEARSRASAPLWNRFANEAIAYRQLLSRAAIQPAANYVRIARTRG